MPKKVIDYSNTIIYVIKCKDDNITEEYIGSTTNFKQRKNNHKSSCNNEKNKDYNAFKYKFIRDNGGWDNWIMLEVEKYPCNDKREAEKREEEIRIERNAKLNFQSCYVENKYKRQLELHPKIHKESYKRTLELNPNHNKEKYKYRLEINPNYLEQLKYRKWTCTICNKEMREDSKNRHNKLIHS